MRAPLKETLFGHHSLSAGQDCAVMFDVGHGKQQVFFGRVLRIVVVGNNGRQTECGSSVSLQDRPPNVKLSLAWFEELDQCDINPDDVQRCGKYGDVPCFQLSPTDNKLGECVHRLQQPAVILACRCE